MRRPHRSAARVAIAAALAVPAVLGAVLPAGPAGAAPARTTVAAARTPTHLTDVDHRGDARAGRAARRYGAVARRQADLVRTEYRGNGDGSLTVVWHMAAVRRGAADRIVILSVDPTNRRYSSDYSLSVQYGAHTHRASVFGDRQERCAGARKPFQVLPDRHEVVAHFPAACLKVPQIGVGFEEAYVYDPQYQTVAADSFSVRPTTERALALR